MLTKAIHKFTYEDYILFPDDRNRHEIIEGEHYMMSSPITKHQAISINLGFILTAFITKYNLGKIFHAPYDVLFSETNVVQPDILFISNNNLHIITEKNVQGSPDLIIEIISEASRRIDKTLKKRLYKRFGVKEYWIIDPVVDILEVYRLKEDRYEKAFEYERDRRFSPEIFNT